MTDLPEFPPLPDPDHGWRTAPATGLRVPMFSTLQLYQFAAAYGAICAEQERERAAKIVREMWDALNAQNAGSPYWDGRLDALDAAEQAILAVEPAAPPDRRNSPLWDGTP